MGLNIDEALRSRREGRIVSAFPAGLTSRLERWLAWAAPRAWLALPFLAIPALSPFWDDGFPQSADGLLHLLRLVLLDRYLREGLLFPRWLPGLVFGRGYPVFDYYGPATYYLAEAFHLAGLGFMPALMAAFSALVILAGGGMYALARALFGPRQDWAALLAAAAYMYAPYLLTNVFLRGALAEVGAMALLPWILWSTCRLMEAEQPWRYVLPVTLSLGGLAVTHDITLLFVPPVWLALVAVLWWRGGRQPGRLAWAAGGAVAAMGASAFFWLPLVLERRYLANAAYQIAVTYLPANVWTFRNFLDTAIPFGYTFSGPFRLGLVQLVLALIGLVAARRRDGAWLFLLGLALIGSSAIGGWALPIWLHSQLLLVAQFPWRLLAVVSVPLALFTGGIVLRMRQGIVQAAATSLLLAAVIMANRPRLDWIPTVPYTGPEIGPAAVAQFEADTGALGTSSAQEFRPRWAGDTLGPSAGQVVGTQSVQLHAANDFELSARVVDPDGSPLRFDIYYFPGWQVTLDGRTPLETYPSTDLGLLTVNPPAGAHELLLSWAGTPLQHLAGDLSLATLAFLAALCLVPHCPRWPRLLRLAAGASDRWVAILPAALLLFGLVATLHQPALRPVQTPPAAIRTPDLTLLGCQLELSSSRDLVVHPYWYVEDTPASSFRVRWELLDAQGHTLSEVEAQPYFNAASAGDWPPGTVAGDAYQLPLPAGMAAGSYQVAVQLPRAAPPRSETASSMAGGGNEAWQAPAIVAGFQLAAPIPPQHQPAHPMDVRLGGIVQLAGYETHPAPERTGSRERAMGSAPSGLSPVPFLVAHAGDRLDYTLYWRALVPLYDNYHAFLHLVDRLGRPLVQEDQVAGTVLHGPKLWDTNELSADNYRLHIPGSTPSGLFWPSVGLYDFKTLARLQALDGATGKPLDPLQLPPIKIIAGRQLSPEYPADIRIGDAATLVGYDLALPAGGPRAGDRLTVTLYYRSRAAVTANYTRFLHLYSPQLGMAAQADALPQEGDNPTWAWVPGEVIVDAVALDVAAGAAPGTYRLQTGLYDTQDAGARLPLYDSQDRPLPDAQADLGQVEVRK